MDPMTILVAIASLIGVGAGAAQIWDFAQKRIEKSSDEPKALPKPVTGKAGLNVSASPSAYAELLSALEWPRLCSEEFLNARGGNVIVVRTPFGGIRRLFAEVAVRTLSAKKRNATLVKTVEELVEQTSHRTRAVLIAEVANSIEAQAWLNLLERAHQERSRLVRRRLRNKFIIIFTPMGAPLSAPSAIGVREANHSPATESASAGLRNALMGSFDPIAFERECRSWMSLQPTSYAAAGVQPASVLRRFLKSWAEEIELAGKGAVGDAAVASFLASIAVGMKRNPASLERAISDQNIRRLYEAKLQSLLLATGSGGLAGIACKIAASQLFRCLYEGDLEARERILRATPLGCGDLPPWVRLICIEAENRAFDEVARSDLMTEISAMLDSSDGASARHDFLGTNALFFGSLSRRHAVQDLRSAPLLWPALDQRSYQGYKFDGCRILQPTLAESFGPVSALCWLGPDLLAFGTFTGELRILQPSSDDIIYSERIDQNAISGLAVSQSERTLLAAAYSGAIHRINVDELARVGTAMSIGSRCRDVAFWPAKDAFLLVNEAGELLRLSADLSDRKVIWQSPNATRLKSVCITSDTEACVGLDSGELAIVNLVSGAAKLIPLGDAPIRCVAWSQLHNRIAAVTDDGVLQVCDRVGQSKERVQVSDEKLWSVAFLGSTHEIVVGGNAGSLRFFDMRTFIETRSADIHSSWIRCLLLNPNEDTIWSGGEDQTLCEFNVRSMTLDSRRVGAAPRIFALRNHNAEVFLVGAGDGTLYCVNAERPDEVKWTGNGHEDQIWCLDICAELNLVLTGSDDRKLGLWRLSDGGLIGHLDCGQGWIGAVCLDQHTRSVLAGDDNGFLHQFDIVSRRRVSAMRLSTRRISSIIATIGGLHLAATEAGEVIALKVSAGNVQVLWVRQITRSSLYCLAELSSKRVIAGGSNGEVHFFDMQENSKLVRRVVSSGPIWNVSIADRTMVQDAIFCSDSGEIGLVSRQDHEILYKRSSPIWACTSAQGGRIAFGGEDGEILVLESGTSKLETFHLPGAFSSASFVGVSGLSAAERSVMAAAGARFA